MSSFLKALPAYVLLILFPFVYLALLAGLVYLAFLIGTRGVTKIMLMLIIVAVGAVVHGTYVTAKALREPLGLPQVTREEAPQLWAMVDHLAQITPTKTVDQIMITDEVNAAVLKNRGKRVLLLGMPLVEQLPTSELMSVLAHELGHYAGGRMSLASGLKRSQLRLRSFAQSTDGLWHLFFKGYYYAVVWAGQWSSREIERASDALAVRAAGSLATANAFAHIAQVDALHSIYEAEIEPHIGVVKRRGTVREAYDGLLQARRTQIDEATARMLAPTKPSWSDEHPPLAERIQTALAAQVPGPAWADAPAVSLFPGGDAQVESYVYKSGVPVTGWDDVMVASEFDRTTGAAQQILYTLMKKGAIHTPTVRAALHANMNYPLCQILDQNRPVSANPGVVSILVEQALQANPAFTWTMDWAKGAILVGPGGPLDAKHLVGPADPGATQYLLGELERVGAVLDEVLAIPETMVEKADGVLGVITACTNAWGWRAKDLVIYRSGILVKPAIMHRWGALWGGMSEERQHADQDPILAEPLENLMREDGVIWIPAEQIMRITVKKSSNVVITIESQGRRKIKRWGSQWTLAFGSPFASLAQMLGPRLVMKDSVRRELGLS